MICGYIDYMHAHTHKHKGVNDIENKRWKKAMIKQCSTVHTNKSVSFFSKKITSGMWKKVHWIRTNPT